MVSPLKNNPKCTHALRILIGVGVVIFLFAAAVLYVKKNEAKKEITQHQREELLHRVLKQKASKVNRQKKIILLIQDIQDLDSRYLNTKINWYVKYYSDELNGRQENQPKKHRSYGDYYADDDEDDDEEDDWDDIYGEEFDTDGNPRI